MKKILLLIICCYAENIARAQEIQLLPNTHIYLVRHAEKQTGNDPVLTAAGENRAGDLLKILKDKHIKRIYVTKYRRSGLTADSLRIQLGIDTVHYLADTTGEDLIAKIKANHDLGKAILVVGHSNTVPQLIKALGVKDFTLHDIPDEEFDNLYLVEYKEGRVQLLKQKYGEKSGLSGGMKGEQ